MQLQNRSIAYEYLGVENLASLTMRWEVYIDEGDFPDYPELRKNFLTINVKQIQIILGSQKGQYRTLFYCSHKGKPWDHTTNEKKKKKAIEKIEEFILTQGNDPILGQYKTGDNNQSLDC
jgi:hypothetical protein